MKTLIIGKAYFVQPKSVMIGNLIFHQDEKIIVKTVENKVVTIYREKTNTTHQLSIYSILPIV